MCFSDGSKWFEARHSKIKFFQWKRRILTYVFYTIPSNETYESNILYIYIYYEFSKRFLFGIVLNVEKFQQV